MITRCPPANDNARPRQGGQSVPCRYSVAVEGLPSPLPGRWRRIRGAVAWVGGALAILAAVGTAAVVASETRTFDPPGALVGD